MFEKYLYADLDVNKKQVVESVRGSFIVVRRELLDKLGWAFDPRYFIWFETWICAASMDKGVQSGL